MKPGSHQSDVAKASIKKAFADREQRLERETAVHQIVDDMIEGRITEAKALEMIEALFR